MAEGEAIIVSGASDGGEGTGTRMVGGSLPPRKRLLAGLKQNGSWLASSSPASPTGHTSLQRIDGECRLGAGTGSVLRSFNREALTGETKVGCMSCGAPDSDAWRRANGNGVVQRFCNLCSFSVNKNSNCPRCQSLYPDGKDPEGWLECRECRRVVHVECEQSAPAEGVPYVCLDCVDRKMNEEQRNALLSTGAPPVRPGPDSKTDAGNCASPTVAECSNPSNKKHRISRESRSKSYDAEGDDIGQFEEMSNVTKVLLVRKSSASKAAAAASAAVLAGRAAAAAKASAAAKAATAVRAAAVAKAALDAAALAARVEAQVGGAIRRNSAFSERAAVGDVKGSATDFQLRKVRPEEAEVRAEDLGISSVTKLRSLDDEELARQLHRAINSSPRISRGCTPLRRKPSTKPAVIANTSHAAVSWPRLGLSTESQPRLQMKQQQTRPRSLQLKELKLIDYRDVKLESKQSSENSRINVSQEHGTVVLGDELLVLKSEPVDSSTITLVGQDSENILLQGATSAPLIIATKGNDCMNGATAVVFGLDENQDRVLSATDVSQAAALLDEVLMYEAEKDKVSKDKYSSTVQDRTDVHVIEGLEAKETTVIEGAISLLQPRFSEQKELESTRGGGTGNSNTSGVAASAQVELSESRDTSVYVAVNGLRSTACDADRSGDSCAGAVKAPLSTISASTEDSSAFESSLDSLPQPSSLGKEAEKVIATETPRGQ